MLGLRKESRSPSPARVRDFASDLAVYDQNAGNWYIWSQAKSEVLAWQLPWGWPGAETVYGDYAGDAKGDLAMYDQPSGFWYIITMGDAVLAWDKPWGWTGAVPGPGARPASRGSVRYLSRPSPCAPA